MDPKIIIEKAESFFNVAPTFFDDKIMRYCATPVPTIVAFCCSIKISKKKLAEIARENPEVQEALDMAATHIERILTEQSLADMIPNSVAIKALQNLSGWDKASEQLDVEPPLDPAQVKAAKEAVIASYV